MWQWFPQIDASLLKGVVLRKEPLMKDHSEGQPKVGKWGGGEALMRDLLTCRHEKQGFKIVSLREGGLSL